MAPDPGIDFHERDRSSRRNDNFDWGYLACASPGIALFVIALLLKACP